MTSVKIYPEKSYRGYCENFKGNVEIKVTWADIKNKLPEDVKDSIRTISEVENFVKDNYNNAKTVLQTPQLGTGHAVSMVCPELENFDGLVLILCGDKPLIRQETLEKFVEFHNFKKAELKNNAIKFRLTERTQTGASFIVKVDDIKLIVAVGKNTMKLEMAL